MSDKNFAADPDALRRSGQRFAALEARVDQIANDVNTIATAYPDAGGDGEFRKNFDKSYVPSVVEAQTFMSDLSSSVEDFGDKTVTAADVFDDADSDATTHSRRR